MDGHKRTNIRLTPMGASHPKMGAKCTLQLTYPSSNRCFIPVIHFWFTFGSDAKMERSPQ
jgi:hypothetical protein